MGSALKYFKPVPKQEAANALRAVATPRQFGGAPMVQFALVGTTAPRWQTLNEALLNIAMAKEIAWAPHRRDFDLAIKVGERALRYNVKCPEKRKHAN